MEYTQRVGTMIPFSEAIENMRKAMRGYKHDNEQDTFKEEKTMKNKKEAFMESAEYLYKYLEDNHKTQCRLALNLEGETVPGQLQMRWHLISENIDFAANYEIPKPPPPAGTPVLVWNGDKAQAVYGISRGELASDKMRLIVQVQGHLNDGLFLYWSRLKEVEEQ